MSFSALIELTAEEAARAMRAGELSAEEYATALLERCEEGAHLNAFISIEPERVLDAARALDVRRAAGGALGPLHGVPVPVKDSVNTRELPTTGGTAALAGFRPREDAAVVRRLLEAGAIVLGKTNLHELSWGYSNDNPVYGPARNPYDPARIPGGSSGGTAVAVAARMSPLGVAEDTEGSTRVPAALCGICGFRPTTGRYPNEGVLPITARFDQVGPHARTVRDLALFDAVAAGDTIAIAPAPLGGARLGIDRGHDFRSLDPELERVVDEALGRLEQAGAVLVEATVPGLAGYVSRITEVVQLHDVVPSVRAFLSTYGAGVTLDALVREAGDDVRREWERGALPAAGLLIPEAGYRDAVERALPELRAAFARYFREHALDARILPATLVPAPRLEHSARSARFDLAGESVSFVTAMSRNAAPASTAGLPAVVVPAGVTAEGIPVGVELDAPERADRALLALGLAVEETLGPLPAPRL